MIPKPTPTKNKSIYCLLPAVWIAVLILLSTFYFLLSAPAAQAAVPVWVVGFDVDTDLSAFLYYLNLHERAQKIADIEKAREDVNKLMYETFVELRDEPLLLEFHKIRESCTPPLGSLQNKALCLFIDEIERALKSRGITIKSKIITKDPNTGTTIQSDDTLCAGGVRTSDGCLLIQKEARIIRNPDEFIFEEPRQKARDFIMCYLAPWRHFPLDTEKPDEVRDALKAHLLFKYSRKQKWLQTAPPESWYTKGRCEIILAQFTCPPFEAVRETGGTISPDIPDTLEVNIGNVCAFANVERFPTLEKALGDNWNYKELAQVSQNPNNTLTALKELMETTIQTIIDQGEKLREADYIAGQGIRSEKYNIGFQDQDGRPYFIETENVISPAIILLQKLQAAAQAQFDLAAQAFKRVETADRVEPNPRANPITPDTEPPFVLYQPSVDSLPAPFEDPYIQLDPRYKELVNRPGEDGPQISSIDFIQENYFNEHYRDILEMHKNTFANTIERWFIDNPLTQGRELPILSRPTGSGGGSGTSTAAAVEVCGESGILAFGQVPVGSSFTLTCNIINNSDEPVTLSFSLNPPDLPFSLSTNQVSVGPRGNAAFEVTFSPTAPVLFTPGQAGIEISSDNPNLSVPGRIELTGEGVTSTPPPTP